MKSVFLLIHFYYASAVRTCDAAGLWTSAGSSRRTPLDEGWSGSHSSRFVRVQYSGKKSNKKTQMQMFLLIYCTMTVCSTLCRLP